MNKLNRVQNVAFELICKDALFLLTLVDIYKNCKNINNNYISMAIPYIGIFADGAEQWGRKVGLNINKFTDEEKVYYSTIRNGHKLYEKSYLELKDKLQEKFNESNEYFYNARSALEKIIGYKNFGVDIVKNKYCGNTILCASYIPFSQFDSNSGFRLQKLSKVAGRISAFYCGKTAMPYTYNQFLICTYKDFHFNKNSPIKIESFDGFILFSILCSINYVIIFIENFFTEEIVQKFKFAYLQYYYLCEFVKEINLNTDYELILNNSLYDTKFRNCLAHYGLGQYLKESDLKEDDLLKGLTIKAFNMNYRDTKNKLYKYLAECANQIEKVIFKR
ncbi:hypothetical protein ACQPUR_20735 [Clostridium neonatale]|uniref:hypothetical protein n=1 Tax=Clostridium neonatale TaxID=137838 RepID=UPI003D33EADB